MKKAIQRAGFLAAGLICCHVALAADAPASSAAPPAAPAAPEAAAAPPGPIAALQQELKDQGFAPGPVNGIMTAQTRQALAAYQRRMRRPPDALAASGPGGGAADPVRRAQTALQRMGLLAGPADGALGPTTRDAIVRFEAARHLPIDPRVSDSLLAALDEAGAAASPAAASPAAAGGPSPPPNAPPAPTAGAPEAAPPTGAGPEATGREPLPPGVNPPPIR